MASKLKERASAIQAAGSVFVFAATDRSVPQRSAVRSASYAEHKCGDCGTVVKASADTPQPFCVTCGSHHVKATSQAVKTPVETSNLAAFRCKTGHLNVLSKQVMAAADNHIHCVRCGVSIKAKVANAATTPEEPDTPKLDAPNVNQKPLSVPDIEKFEINTPVDEPFEPTVPVKSAAEDEPEPAVLDNGMSATELRTPEPGDDPGVDNDKNVNVETADEFTFENLGDDALDDVETSSWDFGADEKEGETAADDLSLLEGKEPVTAEEDFSEEDDGEVFDGADDETADSLVDNLDMDDTCAQLAFVSAGTKLVAMKGAITVATLSPKDAGKNADLLHSDVMATAVQRRVEDAGLRKGLTEMGFKLVRIKASSKTLIDKKVQAKVAEFTKVQAAKESTTAECLALAAAGMARNFWRDKPNPLKAAFEKELAHLGVSNPQIVAATLFKSHGVAYTQTLVEIANSIQSKSAETRKEFASALDMTDGIDPAFDVAEGSNVDDMPMNEYPDSVESRLMQPATVTANVAPRVPSLLRPSSVHASASTVDRAQAILNGSARLSFGN